MEEDEIQAQGCKFPRVGNEEDILQDGGEVRTRRGGSDGGSTNRFHSWHHSSRIIRVSRASGGKDRHSKVMTSKGLRDRRVRLSVNTAIQFYDLQDRLGYDQPSKAVEWLIKSAADAIEELPSLNNTFPDTPKQPSDETRGVSEQGFIDSPDAELDHGENTNYLQNNQSQNLSLSKSACSSTSETSKGSGLSLSRSGIRVNRVKARERARERTAKEKEKEKENENESHHNIANANQQQQHQQHHNVNPISSFTELLTGGMNNAVSPRGSVHHENNAAAGCRQQQWCSSSAAAPMEYFTSGLLAPSSSRTHNHNQTSSGFSLSQIQVGHSHSLQDAMFNNVSGDHHHESHSSNPHQLQQFSFIPDHHHHHHHLLMSANSSSDQPNGNNNDYNLNFTISSGLAGYNRGTLQSNSHPSLLPHIQRFSPLDGSTVPFLIGAAPASSAAPPSMENHHHHHHQFSSVFDGSRLQLYYADGCRHSDQKGKAKN